MPVFAPLKPVLPGFREFQGGRINEIVGNVNSLNVLANVKPVRQMATWGDSRVARVFQSLNNNFGFSSYTQLTCANALAGHPFQIAFNGGVSGATSDGIMGLIPQIIASNAGTLWIQIGVNDINNAGLGYTATNTIGPNAGIAVTLSNVAQVCFQNIQYCVQQFLLNGGQLVICNLECGGEIFGTGQIAATINLNQMLREFAATVPQMILFDMWQQLHDPSLSSTTTIRFKANYAAEASGSGVHLSNLGAAAIGKNLAPVFTSIIFANPYLPGDVNEIPSITTLDLLTNPLFQTTSGGTAGGGITGTVPGGWTADITGGGGTQTGVVSTGTPADGSPGKECIMACTFGGAGDIVRLRQDAVIGNVNVGDILEGVGAVVIDSGATSLAGVQMDLEYSDGSVTWNLTDLKPLNNNAMTTDGRTYSLRSPSYPVTLKGATSFLSMRLYAIGSGAGTAQVRWRTIQARKRFSL